MLFFQCMAALFSSANRRREGINWWLVSYTVLMFSFVTISLGTGTTVQFDCYIDNREYPGVEGIAAPGPLGYRDGLGPGVLLMTDALMSSLTYWLADGFLVGCLFDPKLTRQVSNTDPPPALSLSCDLRQEPLGYRLPLPPVHYHCGYV